MEYTPQDCFDRITTGRNSKDHHLQLYYSFLNAGLENFNPDLANKDDQEKVNRIFANLIICLCSAYSDFENTRNPIFRLSHLSHKIKILTSKISHFITVELVPVISKYGTECYVKVTVANKLRYYNFNGDNFEEIKSAFYVQELEKRYTNTPEHLKFFNLTEME